MGLARPEDGNWLRSVKWPGVFGRQPSFSRLELSLRGLVVREEAEGGCGPDCEELCTALEGLEEGEGHEQMGVPEL